MTKTKKFIPWPLVLMSFLFIGCTSMCSKSHSEMSAEEVVEAYLQIALNMQSPKQKEDLMEFTTGELEASIAAATDDTITAAYIKPRFQLKKFSLVERRDRTPRETEITFQLNYKELPLDQKNIAEAPDVVTENTVAVVRDKGRWLIRDVIGNRTSFDFPVSDLSRITARPAP